VSFLLSDIHLKNLFVASLTLLKYVQESTNHLIFSCSVMIFSPVSANFSQALATFSVFLASFSTLLHLEITVHRFLSSAAFTGKSTAFASINAVIRSSITDSLFQI